jgi:acyl dehydratase
MSDIMQHVHTTTSGDVRGPHFDELQVGDVFAGAPAVTLTEGLQAAHHAIVGCRLRLPLDHELAQDVAGGALASPALVWDVAIGQSTVVTQHVRANLFYRGLRFRRQPFLGDTLHTVTTVAALKENSRRPDREPTGLAVLHIVTTDQRGRTVLDFRRCAMLPLTRGATPTGHRDDLGPAGQGLDPEGLADSVREWELAPVLAGSEDAGQVRSGQTLTVVGADVVTSAPELARLTGNVAIVHHDADAAGGARLVYGGHTIGIALHHLSRALPEIIAVLGWHSCDHVGPVRELDTLVSTVEVERVDPAPAAGRIATVRVRTAKQSGDRAPVLDWRLAVLVP